MKLYLDDLRETPEGWERVYSVEQAIAFFVGFGVPEVLSLDHDLGTWSKHGGDAIKFVDWMCMNNEFPPVVMFHTSNPVGRENMKRALIRHGYQDRGSHLVKEN